MSKIALTAPSANKGLSTKDSIITSYAVEVDKCTDVEAIHAGIINPGTNDSYPLFYKIPDIRLAEQLSQTYLHRIEKQFPNTPIIDDAIAHRGRLPIFLSAESESCRSWQEAACRMLTDKQLKQLVDLLLNDEIEVPTYLQDEIDRRQHLAYLESLEEGCVE